MTAKNKTSMLKTSTSLTFYDIVNQFSQDFSMKQDVQEIS